MSAEPNEKVSFTAPRSIMLLVVVAVCGAGAGAALTPVAVPQAQAQASHTPVPVVEIRAAAVESEARSRAYTDTSVVAMREDMRREFNTSTATINSTLLRLETKIDGMGSDLGNVKIDVATLKARKSR